MENPRSTEPKYFLQRFEKDVQMIFEEVAECSFSNPLHKVNILKANKSLKCDYFIPFQSFKHLKLNTDLVLKKLQSISYISDAVIDRNDNLTLNLSRNKLFETVLGEISTDSDRYGYLNKNKSVLVLLDFVKSKSLDNKRNRLLAEHVVTVLSKNGMKVFHNDFLSDTCLNHSNISRLGCTDKCSLVDVSKVLEDKLMISEYKEELGEEELSINIKRFIDEKNLVSTYGNSLSRIVLPYDCISKSLENTCFIKHLIKDHIQCSPDLIIHIGSQGKNKSLFQGGVLLNMLGDYDSSQVYILSHSVNYKAALETDTFTKVCTIDNSNLEHGETGCHMESSSRNNRNSIVQNSDSLAEQFVEAYHQSIENSTAIKYEGYDPSHESWSSRIQSLTDAAVKFDFLSQSYSLNLVLLPPSEHGSPKTSGVFIQYNHARLSNLFRNFDAMVKDGTYAPLCCLESADLSLLSLYLDWQLLNMLASFPQVVDEVVNSLLGESNKGRVQTSRIACFLRDLCRLLSLYYGNVRVLLPPQMQGLVNARIWLMKGVHQVLHNGLVLMNIKGLDLM